MQTRQYGSTGENLSLIAMGGIVVMGAEQPAADRVVREAVDRGVNYFDVAPSYGDAEDHFGPALVGLRDRVFLACKTGHRTKTEAAAELRASLKRLRTDRFDLYQLHALTSVEDVETALGPGGAMEAFTEARDAGLVRYLGFSAHSPEAALLAMDRFPFDSVLFPFNFSAWMQTGFGPQVLEKAEEKGIARLALKAMAWRPWTSGAEHTYPNCWYEPVIDPVMLELAFRWTLSQSVTAAVPPGDPSMFRMALDFAERFTPITPDEQAVLSAFATQNQPIFGVRA